MTLTILGLVSGLLGLFVYLLKRHNQRADEPKTQFQQKLDENDKALAAGDVNSLLDERLRHTSCNNLSGPASNPNASR